MVLWKKILNDNWTFRIGISTSFDDMQEVGYGAQPEQVTLPHDAMIHTEREDSKTGAAIAFYKGYNYSYSRTLYIGEEETGKDFWLEFEGVFQDAFVYVNGALAGRCNYGYGSYYIHLTEFLQFGSENQIVVIVRNEGRRSRWYTGGGIYRDVYLHVGNPLHIACESVKITSTDIESELAVVQAETPLVYKGAKTVAARVRTELIDPSGKVSACEDSPITLIPGEESVLRQKLFVKNPVLWNVDTPNLYDCKTTVFLDGEVADEAVNRFGIRKLQLDVLHGLRINGEVIKLRGACVHHDLGVIGTATFQRSEYRRVKKLKEAGFNAIRTGAHPSSKAMLDACDELGMLMVDEFTDVFDAVKVDQDYGSRFSDFWRLDLSNMVKRDYNHPSVIMYSLGCENSQIANTYNRRLVKQMVDQIRQIDTTRYTTNDINLTLIVMGYMADLLAEKNVNTDADVNAAMNNYKELLESLYNHERADEIIEEAVAGMDFRCFCKLELGRL